MPLGLCVVLFFTKNDNTPSLKIAQNFSPPAQKPHNFKEKAQKLKVQKCATFLVLKILRLRRKIAPPRIFACPKLDSLILGSS